MDLYKEIVESLKDDKPFALATIVCASGSTPRETGAKMIVYPDGKIFGTIGGGEFERLVIEDCLKLFETNEPHLLKKYSLSQHGENPTGMCCGGNAEVFMELHGKPNRLVIFGGGHIGAELVRIADNSDFKITVVDDRQEIVDSFNSRVDTVLADTGYTSKLPDLDDTCFVVIVTRSHNTDCTILRHVLNFGNAYIGMIGSKAKVAKMFTYLKELGTEQEKLDRVHAPIGLDIDAEGPFEIAISILAEVISAKNKINR